jgi:magnesium chelatase subunit I
VLNPDQLQNNMRQARAEAEQNVPDESESAETEGSAGTDEKKA